MPHDVLSQLQPVPTKDVPHSPDDQAAYEKRLKAHKAAVHELALEGLALDPEAEEWSMQVVRSEITEDEYIAKVFARTDYALKTAKVGSTLEGGVLTFDKQVSASIIGNELVVINNANLSRETIGNDKMKVKSDLSDSYDKNSRTVRDKDMEFHHSMKNKLIDFSR